MVLAITLYLIYVASISGWMRFTGWVHDMWFLILLYVSATAVMIYIGRLLQFHARALKKWSVPLTFLLFLFVTVLQFYSPNYSIYYYLGEGVANFITQDLQAKSYKDAFGILCKYVDEKYPYFEYKDLDWDKVKKEAQEELETVKTDEEFYRVVMKTMSHLQDEYVWVFTPEKEKCYEVDFGAYHANVNGKWIVVEVYSNSSAAKVGIEPGMEIIKVNGKPVNEALTDVPDYLINAKNGSIYGQRFGDKTRLAYLLSRPSGSRISLSYLDLEEKEITLDVEWLELERVAGQPITHKQLSEGFGYIQIKWMALDLVNFVSAFDKALENLWDTHGLIIDIRGNFGGAIVLTDQTVSRFAEHKVNYGGILNTEGRLAPLYVVPRSPVYDRPVVILMDERFGSASSFFPYATSSLEKITLLGRPTRGVVSSPSKSMKLPGGAKVQLVGSGLTDQAGNYVVEWTGVQPDVYVPYSLLDIKSGIDRDLLKAIEVIEKENKKQ